MAPVFVPRYFSRAARCNADGVIIRRVGVSCRNPYGGPAAVPHAAIVKRYAKPGQFHSPAANHRRISTSAPDVESALAAVSQEPEKSSEKLKLSMN